MRKFQNISRAFALLSFGLFVSSCAQEDFDAPGQDIPVSDGTQLVVRLAMPSSIATGAAAEGSTSMTPTQEETTLNNLQVLLFDTKGKKMYRRTVRDIDNDPTTPSSIRNVEIKGLDPGEYNVYAIANAESELAAVTNEQQLKDVILDFSSAGGKRVLTAGNLPMVYQPSAAVKIDQHTAPADMPTVSAAMTFACVKMNLSLVFDNSIADSPYKGLGLFLTKVELSNVAQKSKLIQNTAFDGGAEQTVSLLNSGSNKGAYYTTFTYDKSKTGQNETMISGLGGKIDKPAYQNGRWVWQASLYVPERYASKDNASVLSIEGRVLNKNGESATIRSSAPLQVNNDYTLPRGAFYEFVGNIVKREGDLDAVMTIKDWDTVTFSADMIGTYLSVSKTQLTVKSLKSDAFTVSANGFSDPQFIIPKIQYKTIPTNGDPNGEDLLQLTVEGNTVKASISNKLDLSKIDESKWTGNAKLAVKAGNITKYIDIDYDIKPIFLASPLNFKILWDASADNNTKFSSYTTNLGGIALVSDLNNYKGSVIVRTDQNKTDSIVSDGYYLTLQLMPTGGDANQNQIKIYAAKQPTKIHNFKFYAVPLAALTSEESIFTPKQGYYKEITVTVLPLQNYYTINFRAINDYQTTGDKQVFLRYGSTNYDLPAEEPEGSNSPNWIDGWNNSYSINGSSVNPGTQSWNHKVYIYTQQGETTGAPDPNKYWYFSAPYTSESKTPNKPTEVDQKGQSYMNASDETNHAGWYVFKLNQAAQSQLNQGIVKTPEPGKTLIIFNNNQDLKRGYTLHRMSHHLDAGIQLFDYEDRIGYYLYDPTSEPYYRVYTDRPTIVNQTYTFYSKSAPTGWYNEYGVSNNPSTPSAATHYRINGTFGDNRYTTVAKDGDWYVSTITLKAPKGDEEKAIKISGINNSLPEKKTLYYAYETNVGFKASYAYFFGSGAEYSKWPGKAMTYMGWHNVDGVNVEIFSVEVPSGYEDKLVIFTNGTGQQTTGNGLPINNTYNYVKSKRYLIDSWDKTGTKVPTFGPDVMLFGGRSFSQANFTGYLLNGKWYPGKPSNLQSTTTRSRKSR